MRGLGFKPFRSNRTEASVAPAPCFCTPWVGVDVYGSGCGVSGSGMKI